MKIRFYMDDSGHPHIYRHGVTEYEVDEAFQNVFEDRNGKDDSRVAIARTGAGRLLKVIYVPEPDDQGFVITAVELTGAPLKAFRRRMKKRYGKK